MNELHIRRAGPVDAGQIAENNRAMAQETEGKRLDPARVLAGTRGLLADPARGFYLLAKRDGALLGQLMITFEWSDWRNGVFWWIQSVYVRPVDRRQGVFKALFERLSQEAQGQTQVCGLRLYADRDNLSAHAAYQALGLVETHYLMFERDWSPENPTGA